MCRSTSADLPFAQPGLFDQLRAAGQEQRHHRHQPADNPYGQDLKHESAYAAFFKETLVARGSFPAPSWKEAQMAAPHVNTIKPINALTANMMIPPFVQPGGAGAQAAPAPPQPLPELHGDMLLDERHDRTDILTAVIVLANALLDHLDRFAHQLLRQFVVLGLKGRGGPVEQPHD